MKKNNLWRIIWIIGLYGILILILYLIIKYKVKWENKDLNQYLYFYNCNNYLCTSTIKPDSYYSKIVCEDDLCPYIKDINNNILILTNNNKTWLYDYKEAQIVNDTYNDYQYLNNNYYIFTDMNNMQGIIDNTSKIIIKPEYNKITDYQGNHLIYIDENNKYQIKNIETSTNINVAYDYAQLINNNLYLYKDNNNYYIASFDTNKSINNTEYKYVFVYDEILLTINGKKIDILDTNLKSTLLMTIPTYYEYMEEKERDSLNLYVKDDILYFNVYTEETKYLEYRYDLQNNKILN